MYDSTKVCVKWNDFQSAATSSLGLLRNNTRFSDVTLVCEDGQQVEAHRVILATFSPFFHNILSRSPHTHPLIYMRGLKHIDLNALVDFLYHGEANVFQNNLDSFLSLAEELQIEGMMGLDTETQAKVHNQPNKHEIDNKLSHGELVAPKDIKIEQSATIEEVVISPPSLCDFGDFTFISKKTEGRIVPKEATSSEITESGNYNQELPVVATLENLDATINSMVEHTEDRFVRNGAELLVKKCKACGKEGAINNIKDHIESNHITGVLHACDHCEKSCRTRTSLRIHNHNKHSEPKEVNKSIVFAQFNQEFPVVTDLNNLDETINSMIEHTEDRFVRSGAELQVKKCKACGKEGAINNIKDHIESNHITGVLHACIFCEKSSRTRNALRKHVFKKHR